MRINLTDTSPITGRTLTRDGFLKSPAQLSRTGIQDYHSSELGLPGNKTVKLFRPVDEVFSVDALESFESVVVTVDHPADSVSAENWKNHAAGDVAGIRQFGNYMVGTLLIKDAAAIKKVQDGKSELSCGYSFDLDLTPGNFSGQAYDGVQRNIRGNHVAIVDSGRCGGACRIGDKLSITEVTKMATRKVIVDGVPVEADDSAATVIEKLTTERNKAREDHAAALLKDSITYRVGDVSQTINSAELVKMLSAKDTEIAELKKQVMTADQRDSIVADWAKLTAEAQRLIPAIVVAGKSPDVLRREVVTTLSGSDQNVKTAADAVLGGAPIETADAANIARVFNLISATYKPATASDTRKYGMAFDKGKPDETKATGRDAFLERQNNAWQNTQGAH